MADTLETQLSDPKNDIEWRIARLGPWFHNLHLPGGIRTAPEHPLGDFPAFKWKTIASSLPSDLSGWSALDIGCNAGFYSFELARRGARVTGIDLDEHYLRQARWASEIVGNGDRVDFIRMTVYDLARSSEKYDLVLFMGLFYHLRYPLLALDIISGKVKKLMVFQTLTMPGEDVIDPEENLPIDNRERMLDSGWPKMAFIEKSLAGDPTNWWAPNHSAVTAILRSSGFRVLARIGHEIYLCEPHSTDPWDMAELKRNELASVFGTEDGNPFPEEGL